MRGILIDPGIRTISEADIGDRLEHIYKILSVGDVEVTCITNVIAHLSESLYVDGEALWKKGLRGFHLVGMEDFPLFGRAILLGLDPEGNDCDCERMLVDVQTQIVFHDYRTTGKMN